MGHVDLSRRLRIIVLGYVVRGALGGHAWHHLHYVAGLAALGHDVWFLEDSDDYPSCYDPVRNVTDADPSYGIEFARNAFSRIGMPARWAYYDAHTKVWIGPSSSVALEICKSADLVINLSGVNPIRPWWQEVAVRVFIDTDPGFTQAANINNASRKEFVLAHTAFFTFAELYGQGAVLPNDGIPWRTTRQPIALDFWPIRPPAHTGCFTTVMVWESYPPVEVDGQRLGLKADSFSPYIELPRKSGLSLELALGGTNAPREMLARCGWRLKDPRVPTRTLRTYENYIDSSLGELSVAKEAYVTTRSGWFSERSANYLAMGRPVITQDTGFSAVLPTGKGLLAFSSPEQALLALSEVMANYELHHLAAREVAESCFDSRIVLSKLLDESFVDPSIGEEI